MELLRIESEDPGVFRLNGELDISNVGAVKTELEAELLKGHAISLETSELSFIDSQGLRMLIELGDEARGLGLVITVRNPSSQVQRLLEIAVPKGIPGVELVREEI